MSDDVQALIDVVTQIPLGSLARRSERIRLWLARELDEDTLAYLFPTLDDVAIEMDLRGREYARKIAADDRYATSVVLPHAPDRVHRADLERDIMMRELYPVPRGGKTYIVTEDMEATAEAELERRDAARARRGDSGQGGDLTDARDVLGDDAPIDPVDRNGAAE